MIDADGRSMGTVRLIRFAFVATRILFSLAERFNTRMSSDRTKCVSVCTFSSQTQPLAAADARARARRRHGFVDAEIGKEGKEGKEG